MTRPLRVVPAGSGVFDALRDALAGGPALFVDAGGATGLPASVEQRVALVVETSGSTGTPKRVMLSADAVLASAAASESALGGPGQWLLALPTNYIAGLNVLTRSIAAGFEPVTVVGEHFTAARFLAAVDELTEPARFVSLVPAQLATLIGDDAAVDALRTFTRVLVGGQSMPGPLRALVEERGIPVTRTYGSSETSGGCVYDGRPIGTTAVRIEDGEVWIGGPTLAEGYLGDPGLTAERFVVADGAHWFRTNDSGTWDGEMLRITGRRDDVIISGGLKVSLGAVEQRVRELYPDAVVVSAPDPRWGEVPVIVTADLTPAELHPYLGDLGKAVRHARVLHVDRIPVLVSGKPDRVALAALAAE
ncbi:MAG: AMP-binding protein [Microbacteriaceae bacterium]